MAGQVMFSRAHGETVVIVRQSPGGVDEYGDPISGSEERIDVPGCTWAPRLAGAASSEIDDRGRQGIIVGMTVYMPYDTDLRPSDQLVLDGLLYEVEGEPGKWHNRMTGRRAGLEVAARRSEG